MILANLSFIKRVKPIYILINLDNVSNVKSEAIIKILYGSSENLETMKGRLKSYGGKIGDFLVLAKLECSHFKDGTFPKTDPEKILKKRHPEISFFGNEVYAVQQNKNEPLISAIFRGLYDILRIVDYEIVIKDRYVCSREDIKLAIKENIQNNRNGIQESKRPNICFIQPRWCRMNPTGEGVIKTSGVFAAYKKITKEILDARESLAIKILDRNYLIPYEVFRSVTGFNIPYPPTEDNLKRWMKLCPTFQCVNHLHPEALKYEKCRVDKNFNNNYYENNNLMNIDVF